MMCRFLYAICLIVVLLPLDALADIVDPCVISETSRQNAIVINDCSKPITSEELSQFRSSVELGGSGQWLSLTLINQADETISKLLSLGIPDAYEVIIWSKDSQSINKIMHLLPQSSFSARLVPHRILQCPLEIQPSKASEWIIYYRTHGKTPLHLELLDKDFSAVSQTKKDVQNGIIFGVMLLLIPLLMFYQQRANYRVYAGLVFANLLFVSQVEGYNFLLLWPDSPYWNMKVPAVLGLVILFFHGLFAIRFLELSWRFPRLYRLHIVFLLFALAGLIIQLFKTTDEWVGILIAIYSLLAVFTAWKSIGFIASARFYFLGSLSLITFSVLFLGLSIFWKNIFPSINMINYPKLGYLLESLFFAMAVVSQWRESARRQAELRVRRLAETEQLLQAEQARANAMALAEQKHLQLASASHDISQPLASIRFALSALTLTDEQKGVTQHIDQTLQYAQTLLKDLLTQGKHDWAHIAERVSVQRLFLQLAEEFAPLAHAKQLEFRIHSSCLELSGSNIVIYRLLNNLLANAIRYTSQGRVILGVRRRRDGIELQVGDTGSGIPQERVNFLMQPFQQHHQRQQGYGLGLFIVKTLCEHSGYRFTVKSKPHQGSLFSIFVPYTSPVITENSLY